MNPPTQPSPTDPTWQALLNSPNLDWLDQHTSTNTFTINDAIEEGIDQMDVHSLGEIYPSLIFHATQDGVTPPAMVAKLNDAIDTFHDVKNDGCAELLHDLISGLCAGIEEAAKGRYINLYPNNTSHPDTTPHTD